MRWPFSSRGGSGTFAREGAAQPEPARGTPGAGRAPAWQSLESPTGVLGAMPTLADAAFSRTLPSRWAVPAVLAPLGHDLRPDAPGGLIAPLGYGTAARESTPADFTWAARSAPSAARARRTPSGAAAPSEARAPRPSPPPPTVGTAPAAHADAVNPNPDVAGPSDPPTAPASASPVILGTARRAVPTAPGLTVPAAQGAGGEGATTGTMRHAPFSADTSGVADEAPPPVSSSPEERAPEAVAPGPVEPPSAEPAPMPIPRRPVLSRLTRPARPVSAGPEPAGLVSQATANAPEAPRLADRPAASTSAAAGDEGAVRRAGQAADRGTGRDAASGSSGPAPAAPAAPAVQEVAALVSATALRQDPEHISVLRPPARTVDAPALSDRIVGDFAAASAPPGAPAPAPRTWATPLAASAPHTPYAAAATAESWSSEPFSQSVIPGGDGPPRMSQAGAASPFERIAAAAGGAFAGASAPPRSAPHGSQSAAGQVHGAPPAPMSPPGNGRPQPPPPPPPQPDTPAGVPAAPPGAFEAPADPAELDRLARQLYGRFSRRLAGELLIDRERAQFLSDLG